MSPNTKSQARFYCDDHHHVADARTLDIPTESLLTLLEAITESEEATVALPR